MKIKVFGLVLVLHIAVLGLLLQPGCNTVSKTDTAQNTAPLGNDNYSGLWEMNDVSVPTGGSKTLRAANVKIPTNKKYTGRAVAYQDELDEEIIDLTASSKKSSVYQEKNGHFEYTVARGDSLWKIANEHHVSMPKLMAYNGLNKNAYLKPGQVMLIPGLAPKAVVVAEAPAPVIKKEIVVEKPISKPAVVAKTVAKKTVSINDFNSAFNDVETASVVSAPKPTMDAASEEGIYQVQAGDSLYIIAMQNNTSVDRIRRMNHLDKNLIKVGQKIRIPGKYKGSVDAPIETGTKAFALAKIDSTPKTHVRSDTQYLEHVVASGEFPGLIARKYNMNVADLLELNNVRNPRALKVGTTLKVINPEQMLKKTQVASVSESEKGEAVAVRSAESEKSEESISTINFNNYPVVRVGS